MTIEGDDTPGMAVSKLWLSVHEDPLAGSGTSRHVGTYTVVLTSATLSDGEASTANASFATTVTACGLTISPWSLSCTVTETLSMVKFYEWPAAAQAVPML